MGVRGRIGRGGAEAAEQDREVDLARGHSLEQVGRERSVAFLLARETELRAQHARMGRVEDGAQAVEAFGRKPHRLLLVVREQQEEGLGQSRDVPLRDARLVRERVPAACVDRAEGLLRIVFVEERARAVVDGLPADRRVVRVHHPCTKPTPSHIATTLAWASITF